MTRQWNCQVHHVINRIAFALFLETDDDYPRGLNGSRAHSECDLTTSSTYWVLSPVPLGHSLHKGQGLWGGLRGCSGMTARTVYIYGVFYTQYGYMAPSQQGKWRLNETAVICYQEYHREPETWVES